MSEIAETPRTRLNRRRERGRSRREVVEAILDDTFLCHVSFQLDGQPFCIPMVFGRVGRAIYLHGSRASRMLRALRDGAEACVAVTQVDGLVLARSAFHTSVNYRAVVIFGRPAEVSDPDECLRALEAVVEQAVPGRWKDVRAPSRPELKQTLVLRLSLDECSAKVRSGGPVDDEQDLALDCWAGVVPLRLAPGRPVPDERLGPNAAAPAYARSWRPQAALRLRDVVGE